MNLIRKCKFTISIDVMRSNWSKGVAISHKTQTNFLRFPLSLFSKLVFIVNLYYLCVLSYVSFKYVLLCIILPYVCFHFDIWLDQQEFIMPFTCSILHSCFLRSLVFKYGNFTLFFFYFEEEHDCRPRLGRWLVMHCVV